MKTLQLSRRLLLLLFLWILATQTYSQFNILEDAYRKKSKDNLDVFLKHWQNDIPPISNEELVNLSDTIQNAYKAFTSFYNPTNIKRLGGSEWGDTIYKHVNFLVVQNQLAIKFSKKVFYSEEEIKQYYKHFIDQFPDDDKHKRKLIEDYNKNIISQTVIENWGYSFLPKEDEIITDTVYNFRPTITLCNKSVVYLTPLYEIGITTFLGIHIQKKDKNIKHIQVLPKKETLNRLKFLENSIKIWKGHWGNYWQLLTFPQVTSIVFDTEMKYAKIHFRIVYQGGEAIMENIDGEWRLKSSKLTWIE